MDWNSSSGLHQAGVDVLADNLVIFVVAFRCFPNRIYNLLVVKLLKHTIAAQNNEIVIAPNLEAFYIGCSDHAVRVASVSRVLCLNVSKRSRDRQAAWKYSVRPNYHLNAWCVVGWWIRDIAFILINLASVLLYPSCLFLVFRFVVFREKEYLVASIYWHDSSAVSNICHITNITNNKNDNSTCAASLDKVFLRPTLLMCPFKEEFLSLCNSIFNRYFRILREVLIPDYQLMQLVPKKVGTSRAAVAVINGKEWAPWPIFYLFELRFDDVQDNRDAVLVVISYNSLVSVRRIAAHDAIFLAREFSRVIGLNEPLDLFLFHLHIFLLLLYCHDESSVGRELVLALRLMHIWTACRTVRISLRFLYLLMRGWWLGMTSVFFSSCSWHRRWTACLNHPWILPLLIILGTRCHTTLHATLHRVCGWLGVLMTRRFVTNARTCSNFVYSRRVGRRCGRLSCLLVLIEGRARLIGECQSIWGSMILGITILLTKFLLLVQEQLFWTMVANGIASLVEGRVSSAWILLIESCTCR